MESNIIYMKKRNRKKDFNYITGKKYDGMMGRCYREGDTAYKNYGAKGIKVCEKWIIDLNNFRQWIVDYLKANNVSEETFVTNSKALQLDRIDPTGHYTPENCRLVGVQANSRNRKKIKNKTIVSAEGTKITFGE
jgi:hypothetical protein